MMRAGMGTVCCLCWLVGCGGPQTPQPSTSESPSVVASEPTVSPEVAESPSLEEPSDFTPPEVKAGEDGWELYVTESKVTRDTAEGLAPGNGSPEAAVLHLYASLMRGDQRYEEVLVPRTERAAGAQARQGVDVEVPRSAPGEAQAGRRRVLVDQDLVRR